MKRRGQIEMTRQQIKESQGLYRSAIYEFVRKVCDPRNIYGRAMERAWSRRVRLMLYGEFVVGPDEDMAPGTYKYVVNDGVRGESPLGIFVDEFKFGVNWPDRADGVYVRVIDPVNGRVISHRHIGDMIKPMWEKCEKYMKAVEAGLMTADEAKAMMRGEVLGCENVSRETNGGE